MSKATDRAIERVLDWLIEGHGLQVTDAPVRKQLESLVLAGWREREGPPPYD